MKGSTAKRLGPLLLCSIDWSDVADTYVRTYKVEGYKLSGKFITFEVRTYARSNDWSDRREAYVRDTHMRTEIFVSYAYEN